PSGESAIASCTGRRAGTTTITPQNPYTTEGTAASSSIPYATGAATAAGRYSPTSRAAPRESGTAKIRAMIEVTTVPYTNGSAPYTRLAGCHTVPSRKSHAEVCCNNFAECAA